MIIKSCQCGMCGFDANANMWWQAHWFATSPGGPNEVHARDIWTKWMKARDAEQMVELRKRVAFVKKLREHAKPHEFPESMKLVANSGMDSECFATGVDALKELGARNEKAQ